MLMISSFAVVSYSRSINTLTDKYVSRLIQQVTEQTASRGEYYFKFLDMLAKSPFAQLSFHQFPNEGGLVITRDKLESFRLNTGCFDRITLVANDGHIVTSTSQPDSDGFGPMTAYKMALDDKGRFLHRIEPNRETPSIVLYHHVYDFRHPGRLVGLAVAEVSLEKILIFTRRLELGAGIQITMMDKKGLPIYSKTPPAEESVGGQKQFLATVPIWGWGIKVLIPERQLLKDANLLGGRMAIFTCVVALIALTISFIISRLAVQPLLSIIEGTKEFASGNLDHRIHSDFGLETRQVAIAFNTMADEIKKRQAEMIQADKLASLGLLSAGFAHEVRNPLAGIKTCAQIISRQNSSKEVSKLALGISTEVDRLNKIVSDLLHFSKPKPSKKMPCDLFDLVQQSLKILNSQLKKKKVRIINTVSKHRVIASPEHMIQILINLLLNALSAVAPEKGIIKLSTMVATDKTVVLVVKDNGGGIPQEMLPRIFDPFFSLSRQGNGLGLSVAHMLLIRNDIDIDVKSIEGEGTTFLLYFNGSSSQEA